MLQWSEISMLNMISVNRGAAKFALVFLTPNMLGLLNPRNPRDSLTGLRKDLIKSLGIKISNPGLVGFINKLKSKSTAFKIS